MKFFGIVRCLVQEFLELMRLLKLLFPVKRNKNKIETESSNVSLFPLFPLLIRLFLFAFLIFIGWWIYHKIRTFWLSFPTFSPCSPSSSSSSLPTDSANGIFNHFLYLFLTRHPSSIAYSSPPPPPPPSPSIIPSALPLSSETTTTTKCSKGEKACKEYVEEYFGKPFRKVRPDFMQNPVTKDNLELDCYNEELKLAIEYNGRQHYEYTPFMHSTRETFYAQQYRDLIKQELCRKNNIHLITVPYKIPESDIPAFLENELTQLNFRKREVQGDIIGGESRIEIGQES
jgi:hypothetical protein